MLAIALEMRNHQTDIFCTRCLQPAIDVHPIQRQSVLHWLVICDMIWWEKMMCVNQILFLGNLN